MVTGKYLDPKADLVFKKIFYDHDNLIISLLNALLPLPQDCEIKSVNYQNPELIPTHPGFKDSIVDIHCTDNIGRRFIVEMQMFWTYSFFNRELLNMCKAFDCQIKTGVDYSELKPVYSLNLINDKMKDPHGELYADVPPDEYRHDWALSDVKHPEKKNDMLNMTFIELPKFRPDNKSHKKLTNLWLTFLTQINERTQELPEGLAENTEVKQALDIAERASYSESEMLGYDQFWDLVSRQITFEAEYKRQGRAEGRAEGRTEGRTEKTIEVVQKMHAKNLPLPLISEITGLTEEKIKEIIS